MSTPKENKDQINALLAEAEAKLAEAEKIADATGTSFYWNGPSDGMGGYYTPVVKSDEDDWEQSDAGWQSSSNNC